MCVNVCANPQLGTCASHYPSFLDVMYISLCPHFGSRVWACGVGQTRNSQWEHNCLRHLCSLCQIAFFVYLHLHIATYTLVTVAAAALTSLMFFHDTVWVCECFCYLGKAVAKCADQLLCVCVFLKQGVIIFIVSHKTIVAFIVGHLPAGHSKRYYTKCTDNDMRSVLHE